MRIGIVSPYSFTVPGGVQGHIKDLAETLEALGHEVSVLAPSEGEGDPDYVVSAGRAIPVRYNGSVARLAFGPIAAARVRRWIRTGKFDVLHVHEPLAPSLSLLAVLAAQGPVVATFHTAMTRSRTLLAGRGVAQLVLERLTARIAVSALARRVQVEHLGGGATEIPNGVMVRHFATASPLPNYRDPGQTVGFVGRFGEPRKGFAVLRDAFVTLANQRPGLRLLVLGRGDPSEEMGEIPEPLRERVEFLGMVPDEEKARMLRSLDCYVAPNTGGESFGMVLTEAMAAGAPIVASDLDAFRRVLDDGNAGALFPAGDSAALATTLGGFLDDASWRANCVRHGRELVRQLDWPRLAERVVEVYEAAMAATGDHVTETEPVPSQLTPVD